MLVRQALKFSSWMCLVPLTCKFPSVLWPGIIIWDKQCVVAAQTCERGVDEVCEDGKGQDNKAEHNTLSRRLLPSFYRVPN